MAEYRTTIRSDRIDLDLNTTSYQLSLSRVGAQGSAGTNGTEYRLTVFQSTQTYDAGELVVASSAQGAQLYRAIADLAAGSSLTNTAQWQEVGGDEALIFSDAGTVDFTQTGNTIIANLDNNSVTGTQLENLHTGAVSYTSANITVDAQGRVTAASNGSGGGGHSLPSEHATISLSPNEIEAGTGDVVVTGTISVASPYTYVGTGNTAGNAGTDTIHVTGLTAAPPITHTGGVTGNTFSFTIPSTDRAAARTITVRASVTASYQGTTYAIEAEAQIHVYEDWFAGASTSVPTGTGDLTDQNRFSSPERLTLTRSAVAGENFYVAIPTRTGGYTFRTGSLFADVTQLTSTFTTGYTAYVLNDYNRLATGTTLVIDITT